jgi:hypothetical protein
MQVTEAVDLINERMILKPGWTVRAQAAAGTDVTLLFSYDTRDSSEEYAPAYWRPAHFTDLPRDIDVRGARSKSELLGLVLRTALELEMHEWLEFARYLGSDGRWHAPFHPHRTEGKQNWLRRTDHGHFWPRPENSLAA